MTSYPFQSVTHLSMMISGNAGPSIPTIFLPRVRSTAQNKLIYGCIMHLIQQCVCVYDRRWLPIIQAGKPGSWKGLDEQVIARKWNDFLSVRPSIHPNAIIFLCISSVVQHFMLYDIVSIIIFKLPWLFISRRINSSKHKRPIACGQKKPDKTGRRKIDRLIEKIHNVCEI